MYTYRIEFVRPDSGWSTTIDDTLKKVESFVNEQSQEGWDLVSTSYIVTNGFYIISLRKLIEPPPVL